ncbi:putative alcohol dehydrogenase [Naematelia encephala]|uniref:Putative alcohol dehydrogenase n=1 Tax=Naematelia encephala TaxID=71784 RepID=A0A1Y2BH40_9TREE|nr:putative alcohol dehydrogenase [Naematelia encephala]
MSALPRTMKGVVLSAPYEISVQDQPVPSIQEEGDVIVRVHVAGLCGSDLHFYRGTEMTEFSPFIMGHEAVGEVVEVGSGVTKWHKGDIVISPFSLSCGDCFYCKRNYTARCTSATLLGSPTYPGAQAEYLRVAMADASLFAMPPDLPKELGLMLADILPTGYSTAYNARRLADEEESPVSVGVEKTSSDPLVKKGVCVVVGCGPVGLCAITSATTMFEKVFATDLQTHRLQSAKKHGAIALPLDQLRPALLEATGNRGADAALELVGHEGALITAIDLVRPYGVISVGGVHSKPVNISGDDLYGKKAIV